MRWDVKGLKADAATVDALARLQLAARRGGVEIVLYEADEDLRRLIELMGLGDVLPVDPEQGA